MKTLIIVRHAKSSWDNPTLSDFNRPLNDRGLHDAPRMAKRFKEKELIPERLISSPAKRAHDTAIIIAGIIGYPETSIIQNKKLYHAEEDEILDVVQGFPEPDDVIMLFGHNPGLTDFANRLMDIHIDNIPTCGVAASSIAVDRWKEVNWSTAKLLFFDYPKLH
ncbi:MAG: histidine phosphatase family protein [Cyclobacteriaceae bacterium]|nr:histidine phosphatase family protein [Cyclobacteriaceae bacterium]